MDCTEKCRSIGLPCGDYLAWNILIFYFKESIIILLLNNQELWVNGKHADGGQCLMILIQHRASLQVRAVTKILDFIHS